MADLEKNVLDAIEYTEDYQITKSSENSNQLKN